MNILRSLAPAKLQKHDEEVRTAATTYELFFCPPVSCQLCYMLVTDTSVCCHVSSMQLGLERLVINKEGLKESAEEAFLAFVRCV